jgi:hypothetical protein
MVPKTVKAPLPPQGATEWGRGHKSNSILGIKNDIHTKCLHKLWIFTKILTKIFKGDITKQNEY